MFLHYYASAFSRSWSEAWAWATGQGIVLAWSLAVAVLIISIAFAVIRAFRKHHSWPDAVKDAGRAGRDFFVFGIASSALVLVGLVAIFFLRDAPDQIAAATKDIDNLKRENAKAITDLKAKYDDDTNQLNKKIVDLQLRLDDRERNRRQHEEEIRVKNERINTIAGLIATGNVIAKSFEEKNDKELVKEQYLEWERGALDSLASGTFGVTYLAPFGSARGPGISLMNHNIEGNGWYSLLEGKLAVLNGFLVELRKQ
jgi:hypothetical protein